MRLGYDLKIEQAQKMSMTPELIQAIQILQLNQQELIEYVQNELLENPVLESEKSYEDNEIELCDNILGTDQLLKSDFQWSYTSTEADEGFTYEQYVSQKETLTDFLLEQLYFSDIKERKKEIGRYIIEAIDDNGYLTVTIDEIAKAMGTEAAKAEAVLTLIQTFDPPGVAARNLQECLINQLALKGLLTDEIEYLILNMLEDLADKRISSIARALGMKKQDVQQIADLIKTLEPRPGRAFSGKEDTKYIVPDMIVEKVNQEYVVSFNEQSTPHLMISSYYQDLTEKRASDPELEKYLTEKYHAAVWLIRSIEQRRQTIFQVTDAIIRHQKDFFTYGDQHLKPLTLKEIAEDLDIHESTVSRSINEKFLLCPRGIFELKFFFSSGVTGEGGGVSSNSVKSIIREIISGENPRKPYSDQDMVRILNGKGIAISRRTVTKYREGMDILSSAKRRRF